MNYDALINSYFNSETFAFCNAGIIKAVDADMDILSLDKTADAGGIRKNLAAVIQLVRMVPPEDIIADGIALPTHLHIDIAGYADRYVLGRNRCIAVPKAKHTQPGNAGSLTIG